MTKEKFLQIANEKKKKIKHGKNIFFATLFGGMMGIICQLLHDLYQMFFKSDEAFILSSLTLIILTGILTVSHVYKKISRIAGAGLFIPVSGFSNSVISSALDAKAEGPIYGVGSRVFSLAGSVIIYGVFSSILVGIIYYLILVCKGVL